MNDHIDLDLIAAFREGLLDPPTGERIRRHLDGCAACARREAALDEVTTHLAGAPTPPVPPTVASRLDAALAGEIAAARKASQAAARQAAARQPAAGSAPANPPAAGLPTAAPEEAPATRPRSRRFGAVRGPGRNGVSRRDADRPSTPRPSTPRPSTRRPSTRRTAALLRPLAAVAAVCLLAVGGFLLLRSNGPGTSSSAARPAKTPASGPAFSQRGPIAGPQNSGIGAAVLSVRSGISYQPGTLREDANKVLQRYASRIPSPGHVGSSPMRAFGMSQMSGCLLRVSNGRRPLIADSATYAGRPATVIIAPANSTARGHVWVVGPACSATASDIIAQSGL